MKNRYERVHFVFHFLGNLLVTLGAVIVIPIVMVILHWGRKGDGWRTLFAFCAPSCLSFLVGSILRRKCRATAPDMTGSMLVCGLSWLAASVFGALPFVIGLRADFLDGYFEAMSGFTTTGATMFTGLDQMPRSIIFWRAFTQWLGGIGILSFFLGITFQETGSHHLFGAESHKISSTRPVPGMFHTLKILWGIYGGFSFVAIFVLWFEGMTMFDAVCHALTTVSTGGFSPYDASIAHFRLTSHPHYRLIEYTIIVFMILGGINFLIHYRVLRGDYRALWDNLEIRYWWRFIGGFTVLIVLDHLHRSGILGAVFTDPSTVWSQYDVENIFRTCFFQVVAVLTTSAFVTQHIGSDFFPVFSRQLFTAMMVIGGCVGSTSGGFKVLRTAILTRLMGREVYKLRVPDKAVSILVIDKQEVSADECRRTAALFFTWIAFVLIGGGITAVFSSFGPWESCSGMFSALGNIGTSFITVEEMIKIHPVVKITYIFGMLAGRLEILPVLLLLSKKAWR